jgi:O-antigen ligase
MLLVVMVNVPSVEASRVLMQLPTAPGLAARAPCAEWIAQGMPARPGEESAEPGSDAGSATSAVRRIFEGQTLTSRWVSYQQAWNDVLTRPLLGNGANSFGQKYTTTAHTPGWISNLLLMALHDAGVLGLVLLLGWFVWFGWTILQAWRRAPPSPLRTMVLALGIGLACLLLTYQVTTMLWFGFIWWLLAIIEAGAGSLTGKTA